MEQTDGDADMAREVAQSMLDDKVAELEQAQEQSQREPQEEEGQSQETAYVKPSEHEGKFGIGDKMTFYVDGKPIEAEVVQTEDVDGVVVQTSERVNGHLINQYTREELDALTAPPQQANDNADVARPQAPEAGTEVQNETEEKSPDELPAFDGDKFNETHPADEIRQPQVEQKPNEENNAVDEASIASKIPQGESGEYDYMQAEPSKAWAALLEQTEGDADMAREVAQSMLDDKVAELEQAQKQKPKEGKSVADKIAARKEHKANIERIESEIERWQQILSQSEQQPTTEETKPKEETPSNHIADVSKKEEETTQQENIKLSDEVDENGRQFVLNSEGNLAFGEITEDTGLTAAPILLSEGMITNRATNDGYGLAHIEARHGEEIRKAGYKSVLDFIEQVAKNYDVIKEGNMRDGRPTYRLMLTDKHNNTLMVELSGDGTFWNINTAGIFKTSYGRKNREVYNRHTTVKQSAETTETSQDAEQSDTQAPSRMNVPTTSESEDTKSKAEGQEKSEESKETSLSEQISTASAEVNTNPTEAQKEAGNFKKGHVQVGTFDITIEQPQGSIRRGKDANGKKWESKMHNTYGYFRGTEGVDGDHIDVFLSNDIDGWNGRKVFVVDQYNPDGTFDEHKVMLGFNDIDEAKSDYLANYEKGWENGRRIDVTPVSLEDFEKWIGSSHRKTKAFAEYAGVKKETEEKPLSEKGGKVPFHRAGESNGELTKTEVALRDAVIDQLRKSGIDVVSDVSEGQRVLDMANGKERLSGKQKRALETAEQSQRTTIATVVSSADGAKVLNNLDNLAKKLLEKESNRSKTFMGDVARAIGAKEKGSSSQYATFETKNGTVVTIRLANHNAKVSNFDNAGKDNAISIVITRKPNKGMTNDGTAHIVEFFYPETALQRADGKPLAEIVRSIKQALYSGEFKDTTGIAERQEVNGDVVREHRVYHGSGADFEAFDHSHMGEGEGAQAYGWGTYVTEVEGIGRTYAEANSKRPSTHYEYGGDTHGLSEERINEILEVLLDAKPSDGHIVSEYEDALGWYRNRRDEYSQSLVKDASLLNPSDISIVVDKTRNLYSVEIPDDNGKNYLDWNERLSDSQIEAIRAYLSENYRRNKLEDFDASIAEVKGAPNADEVNAWARRGENVYKMLSHLLGSDDAASKALSEMGFTGIKYPAENRSGGRKDGARNYVIFNENDAKIVDKVRFFKTQGGEAYGFTVGGKIYIDPHIASSETAVHEYAHLWAEALRSANAKEWENVVGLMRGTSVWNEVSGRYPELKSDDDIADEVLATYSGRRGSERLREEMDRIKGSERSVADKARALGALERVRRALDRFWHGVADFLGIHYKSADEVADRVMRDLLNGVDPRRFVKGESDGRVREQFIGEDGVSEGRGEQGRSLRGDEALTALNRIFDGEVKDELPPTIPTIEKFRQIFSKPIRTFLGELIKVKDNVYNKIQKEKRTRVSGAVMPTIKNADFAMRDTDGSTLYIKRFNNNTSDSTYNIAVVNKHGEVEDYISSVHIKRDANLRNKIKNGAELLLPNKRNGDGTVSRNNSTPDAKLGKISEKSDANGTRFRDEVDGFVSSSVVDGLRERAVELGRELGADVDVVSDVSEITDPNPEVQERKRRAKGWYDAKTGRVVINLAAHSDMADVEQTLLHEIVGHRGLRGLVGHENFNGFLDGIYEHASDGVREGIDDIARRKGCSKRVATEEYMSGLAEGGFADRKNAGLWQQIRQWFSDMLSRAKIKLNFSISDNELRYLLWRSHELSRMNGREGVVGRARDLAMQNRLGVGNGVDLFRTSKQLDAEYGSRWIDEQTNADGRHTTQVKNTVNSYKKFGEWVQQQANGKKVDVLDASSGLGVGTEWLREHGMNVDDVEPYPSANRTAPTYSSYEDIDKRYDYIISNAVLNVIPEDWRADVLHSMADKLKVGGKLVINVRGAESIRNQGTEGQTRITLDDASEILVLRSNGTIKAYQKGFTKAELKGWCEKELGDGYSVEVANSKNAGGSYDTTVVVTKNNESNTIGVASGATHPSRIVQEVRQPYEDTQDFAQFDSKVRKKSEYAEGLSQLSSEIGQKKLGAHEFLYGIAKAFGFKGNNFNHSMYRDLGGSVGIRISDHSANAENFAERGSTEENYGLVVKLSPHRFRSSENVDYLEYMYYPDKLTQERQKEIVDGLKDFLQTGDYSKLPSPDRVNKSGKFEQESSVDSYDGDLETLFRDADSPVDYERALIRDSYERRLKDVWFQSREALQDGMLSLKETMKDIWRSAGKKFSQITDIPDYANPYIGQNRLSSRNAAEVRDFKHNLFRPLLREVGRLTGFSADGRAKLTDYMMAKHGLERNKVMAERDAKAAYEAEKLKDPNTTKTLADFVAEYRKKDYSGLTSLTGLDDVAAAEAEAKNMVADYEANHDTANLWARTKAVTDAIVQKQYDSGYINSITRNAILNMYDNYIPLRGFEDKTAEDVYSYMKHSNSAFNAPIKTARGRKSKADDPFANMLAMAESGIMRGNRNKLVKLPLLSLVLEHPTDLISVSDVWFALLLAMCKF